MENLPDEIIAEIFLRLPTKSLARLRCVSSSWNSLLSDPSFIRIHLHRSSLPQNRRLLLKYTDRLISKLVILPPALDDFSDLNPPPRSSDLVKFEVVGACNGVICLTVFREQNPRRAEILLWNPSINHLFTLPCSHSPISASISFGFNPSSGRLNDFKVLKIKFEEGGIRSRVEIYSLVTNSWKQIGDSFPSWCRWFGTDHHQVILNRFICWCPPLGYDFEEMSSSLKLFDVASEEFREIDLPESISSYHKNIALLDDCLCVVTSLRRNLQKIKVFEVWKMEELGIEVGSWSKVYKFELSTVMFPLYKPLGLGHGGCCVLFAHNKSVDFGPKTDSLLAVYDTVEDKFGRAFDLSFDSVSSSRLCEYTESLISPLPVNK